MPYLQPVKKPDEAHGAQAARVGQPVALGSSGGASGGGAPTPGGAPAAPAQPASAPAAPHFAAIGQYLDANKAQGQQLARVAQDKVGANVQSAAADQDAQRKAWQTQGQQTQDAWKAQNAAGQKAVDDANRAAWLAQSGTAPDASSGKTMAAPAVQTYTPTAAPVQAAFAPDLSKANAAAGQAKLLGQGTPGVQTLLQQQYGGAPGSHGLDAMLMGQAAPQLGANAGQYNAILSALQSGQQGPAAVAPGASAAPAPGEDKKKKGAT